MCLTVALNTLVNLTGASLVADYALIALAALLGLIYWAVVILPQRGRAWNLQEVALDEDEPG